MVDGIIETERLLLTEVSLDDAAFIYKLVNQKSWLKYIGDRNVNSLDDAVTYIQKAFLDEYAKNGFGLYLVRLKEDNIPIGISGLVKRPSLENVDIGFAQLEEYAGKGYAFEAAQAVMSYAHSKLKLDYIVAITSENNIHSIRLLEKLGLKFSKKVKFREKEEVSLYIPCDV